METNIYYVFDNRLIGVINSYDARWFDVLGYSSHGMNVKPYHSFNHNEGPILLQSDYMLSKATLKDFKKHGMKPPLDFIDG